MLSELQRRIARIVLAASPDPELVLAGGAAVILLELVDRGTVDLDFFTTSPRVEELLETIVPALEGEGFRVRRDRVSATFARLGVARGSDDCQVDIAQDFRMLDAVTTSVGPVLAAEELAADKTLTLFTRAEPRDFVDVYFLAQRFGKERVLELAKEKDRGFDEGLFAEMLGAIGRLDRPEFAVDDSVLADLKTYFAAWRAELTEKR